MSSNILSFSGKKQSGKNTSANWLLGLTMCELSIVRNYIHVNQLGQLEITDLFGDENFRGIFDYYNPHPAMAEFLEENIHPWFKIYSFADLLKRDVCMQLLGLTEEQCFGTDDDKNSKTHLQWENMPGHDPNLSGPMTAREVMQFVGTDIFRKMYHDVWAKSTVNRIVKEDAGIAIVSDCRFPNEVEAVQEVGGKVIRFLRNPFGDNDQHDSETALDPENFDQSKFDAIIDNRKLEIGEQNKELYDHLVGWNYIPKIQPEAEKVTNEN